MGKIQIRFIDVDTETENVLYNEFSEIAYQTDLEIEHLKGGIDDE